MTGLDPAISEIWTKKVAKLYNANAVMEKLVNTEFEGEIKEGGDVVKMRIPADVTLNSNTREAAVVYETLTWTVQNMTIDQEKNWAFRIDNLDQVQIDVDVKDPELEQAAIKVRNAIDTRLLSHYANTDASNIIGSTSDPIPLTKDNIYYFVASMGTKLDNANVMGKKRHLVVPPAIKELIITSPQLSARSTAVVDSTIKNGLVVKEFAGFEVHVTTNMSQVSSTYPLMFFTELFISFANQHKQVDIFDKLQNYFASGARGQALYGSTVFTHLDGEGGVLYAAA